MAARASGNAEWIMRGLASVALKLSPKPTPMATGFFGTLIKNAWDIPRSSPPGLASAHARV